MRQPVQHVVDAELDRFVRGIDWIKALTQPLPVLGEVGVVIRDCHESLGWIVVFEEVEVLGLEAEQMVFGWMREVNRLQAEERIEDPMGFVELDLARVGEHASHLRLEVVPLLELEVMEDHEAALEQVRAKTLRLAIGHDPEAGLPHEAMGYLKRSGSSSVRIRLPSVLASISVTSLRIARKFCSARGNS